METKQNEVVGWLIVKTENKKVQEFNLYEKANYIGRPTKNYKPDISITGDRHVSRFHAVLNIFTSTSDQLIFSLTDSFSNVPTSFSVETLQSLNGCYLNGEEYRLRINDEWILSDGDTIQIGETKLILKKREVVSDVEQAKTIILQQSFEQTVLIPAKKSIIENTLAPLQKQQKAVSPGWLVLISPYKNNEVFELKFGKNHIGRGSQNNNLDISVKRDVFVSRYHAILLVEQIQKSNILFKLNDNHDNLSNKPSTFGTYINGNSKRIKPNESRLIKDGDTIQVGQSKLVLKTFQHANTKEDALSKALSQNFAKDVVLPNEKDLQ